MPDEQIHPTGTVSVPADYKIPPTAELLLKNAYAHFDGSGAAGPFLPLLRIVSDAGSTVIESAVGTAVAAGESADVSWFPRVAAAAAAGTGIQFDTDNVGDWLSVETTEIAAPPSGYGIVLNDSGGSGIRLVVNSTDYINFIQGDLFYHLTGGLDIVTPIGSLIWDPTGGLQWTLSSAPTGYGFTINNNAVHGEITLNAEGNLNLNGNEGVNIQSTSGDVVLQASSNLIAVRLPTSDPGVAGALWNNGGVVHVSP